jgi:hypothetical protein
MKLIKAMVPGILWSVQECELPCQKESLHLLIERWNVAANFERGVWVHT